jgi:hypothetical protein
MRGIDPLPIASVLRGFMEDQRARHGWLKPRLVERLTGRGFVREGRI